MYIPIVGVDPYSLSEAKIKLMTNTWDMLSYWVVREIYKIYVNESDEFKYPTGKK